MQASAKTKARRRTGGLICGPRRLTYDRIRGRYRGPVARQSDRHRTIHSDAMHQPPQRKLIVTDCQMLSHAVVPHQQVSEAPLMPVAKLRPRDYVRELLDEGEALLVRYSANPDALAFAHVNGFSSGDGVCSYDGLLDVLGVRDTM